MTGWGGGYVTDISYLAQAYGQQSPHFLNLACLLVGAATEMQAPRQSRHHLELGCGRGMSALIFAAANPDWQVTAVDFMPAAIAEATAQAQAAGLENLTFIEADLAVFAESAEARALPMASTVSVHGVWSWVPAAVRDGILRLLASKVLPGGIVHVSYNALPGLQGALAMQRVIRETGSLLAHRSDEQAVAGMKIAREMLDLGVLHLSQPAIVQELLPVLDDVPTAYLAHEYMNAVWTPFFHTDVADAMQAAKLDFVAEGVFLNNFMELQLSPEMRAIAARFGDNSRLCQLLMDCGRSQGLRHDIYVRGHRKLTAHDHAKALSEVTLMATTPASEFRTSIKVPAGDATLAASFYGPIMAELEKGPRRVGELLSLPDITGSRRDPVEVVGMLIGTGQAAHLPFPGQDQTAAGARLNAVLARTQVTPANLNVRTTMVARRTGAGFPCRVVDLFLIERIAAAGGVVDPLLLAQQLSPGLPPDEMETLSQGLVSVMEERLAVWQAVGAI